MRFAVRMGATRRGAAGVLRRADVPLVPLLYLYCVSTAEAYYGRRKAVYS
jgi:hypothetical protein